jgi:hypothetical protein
MTALGIIATYAFASTAALSAYGIANSIDRALLDARQRNARRNQPSNLANVFHGGAAK